MREYIVKKFWKNSKKLKFNIELIEKKLFWIFAKLNRFREILKYVNNKISKKCRVLIKN